MSNTDEMILKHRGPAEYRLSDVTHPDMGSMLFRDRRNTEDTSLVEIAHIDDDFRMEYFQSALYASVLEDTITEFRILEECNSKLRIIKAHLDYGFLISEKFGVSEEAANDELSGLENFNQDMYTVNMLDKNRKFIQTVLADTYSHLSMNRSFHSLTRAVEHIIAQDSYRYSLEQEEAKNKQLRRELIRQLRQQRNHNMALNYDTDVIIDQLRTKVEDSALLAEARSRYITKWQTARTEQHTCTIFEKERVPSESIDFFKQQIDHEQRAHTEIEAIVSIITSETLAKVEHWMNKYDEDMEAIDLSIQIMKSNFDSENDKRIELEKTYAKHVELMANWRNFKAERERQRLYRLKMNDSAVIVQAWWRGIQVRFELGPYKVKKRRGGGGKKKSDE